MFFRLRHKIAHLLHVNGGEVVTWWESEKPAVVRTDGPTPGNDYVMVGFRCLGCGKVSGATRTKTTHPLYENPAYQETPRD